jgi:MYXO-CTERM domain-containing protein
MSLHTPRASWIVAVLLAGAALAPGSADANAVVTYTTTQHGGNFAPRNAVVAWVETTGGAFIKTIGRWAGQHRGALVGWITKAGANDADAVSGASRQNHVGTVTATWDLKDKAGNELPDGTYTIRIELADSNANSATQNDQGTYTLVKNGTASTVTAQKSGGFTATIAFTPNVSATCNNGVVDPGETCDPPGSCPTSCAASADACMPNVLVGSAAGCTAKCVVEPVTGCVGGDGCCPMGCDATTDTDCAAAPGAGGGGENQLTGGCQAGAGAPWPLGLAALGLLLATRRRITPRR